MQVIPRGPNFWGDLGAGLGELAGFKLAQLTKAHEQKKEKEQFTENFAPILGKSTATFLSNLSPEERRSALSDMSSLLQLNAPPSSREQASQLGGMNSLQQLSQQRQPQQQQNEIQSALQQYFGRPGLGQQQAPQPEYNYEQQNYVPENEPQEPQLTPERAKAIENIFASPEERRERRKQEFQERQLNLKETKGYIDTLKQKEKAAKENDLRLNRMEQLIERGNLPNSALWSSLNKFEELPISHGAGAGAAAGGLLGSALFPGVGTAVGTALGATGGGIVGALVSPLAGAIKTIIKSGSPDIEEFEKLSNDFVKNAKQYFGARLTDRDLKVFMDTIPTLMNTDAGKKKIIENLKSLNQLAEVEAKAARSIIKSNGGVPPLDIEQQVQDRISKKIDRVANKFILS